MSWAIERIFEITGHHFKIKSLGVDTRSPGLRKRLANKEDHTDVTIKEVTGMKKERKGHHTTRESPGRERESHRARKEGERVTRQ